MEGGEGGVSGASLPEGSGGVKRGLQAGQAEHACRKRAGSGTQVVQARLHRLVAADDAWLQIHYISHVPCCKNRLWARYSLIDLSVTNVVFIYTI